MRQGPRTRIKAALAAANREISGHAARDAGRTGIRYAAGLAGEGYAGGYAQALRDVLLVLDGGIPDTRGYWQSPGG